MSDVRSQRSAVKNIRKAENKKLRSYQILSPERLMEKQGPIRHFRELNVYRRGFDAAMEIFQITKTFPVEEKYSLVDQIRRCSRSVCSNLAEAWRKRKYHAVFKNKITDSMMEASETQC